MQRKSYDVKPFLST